MLIAILIALPAVALLCVMTRRQATQLFGARLAERRRRRLVALGWLLMALSLAIVVAGPDMARTLIGWTCASGLLAFAASLLLAATGSARPAQRRSGQATRPARRAPVDTNVQQNPGVRDTAIPSEPAIS